MLDSPTVENSVMVAEQTEEGSTHTEKRSDSLWYTYCNKPRHTRDKCWKLHGKPSNRDREGGCRGNSLRKGGQAHVVAETGEESKPKVAAQAETATHLNQVEIERVRTFLSKLEKPTGACSLAYSGKFPFSFGLNVSDTTFNHYWILDSEAIDHITPLAKLFSTYSPCPSNKKIATADGTLHHCS